jgi:hypothetical protein
MKKIIISLFATGAFLFANFSIAACIKNGDENKEKQLIEWKKSKSGIWTGKWDGTLYYYKVSDDKIMRSTNKKSWVVVENKRWADIDGKWMQIDTGSIMWSDDSGRTWAPVPERRWRAANGKWYMFDQRWNLMIEK